MTPQSLFHSIGVLVLATAASIGEAHAVFVRTPPPAPPPHNLIYRAPRHGRVWTTGYYRWRGGSYYWVPGRWVVPPHPGAVWVAPRWRHAHGGYTFAAGYWR
jgi:hypothetical protein